MIDIACDITKLGLDGIGHMTNEADICLKCQANTV